MTMSVSYPKCTVHGKLNKLYACDCLAAEQKQKWNNSLKFVEKDWKGVFDFNFKFKNNSHLFSWIGYFVRSSLSILWFPKNKKVHSVVISISPFFNNHLMCFNFEVEVHHRFFKIQTRSEINTNEKLLFKKPSLSVWLNFDQQFIET